MIFFYLIPYNAFPQPNEWDYIAEWKKCEQSNECTTVLNECFGPDSVNEKFTTQYKALISNIRPRIECASHCYNDEEELKESMRQAESYTICVEKKCAIKNRPECTFERGE